MHIMIKGNYLNLDDALVVSEIKNVGNEGAKLFFITLKNGKSIEFFYHSMYEYDVLALNANFHFGTSAFFCNTHKNILNILTNVTELPKSGI